MADVRRQLPYLAPLLAWMGVIALLSTDLGSRENTMQGVFWLLRQMLPDLEKGRMEAGLEGPIQVVRKMAHLLEYAVLAFLACRWLRFSFGRPRQVWQRQAVALSGAYAVLDEAHQAFVRTRSAYAGDIGVDLLGALVGVILFARHIHAVQRAAMTQEKISPSVMRGQG